MHRLVIALSSLFMSVALLAAGNAFVMTLLGVRLGQQQVEPLSIGLVLVFYSVGFVIGTRYSNIVIRRVGHIRSFAVFSAVLAMAALAYPLFSSLAVWAGLRLVGGITVAGLMIVIESWFSYTATNENRGTLFATYQIGFYLSVAAGQLLIQVAPPESFVPFSIAAILMTAALIPLSLSRMHSPSMEDSASLPLRDIFREAPLGVVAATINGILMSSFYAVGPVFATSIALSLRQVSLFMAIAITCAMLFAWPIGQYCDRYTRSRVLQVVCLFAAVASFAALWFDAQGFPLLALFTGIYMGLAASIYPIAVAITNDRMASNEIVAASATLLLCYGVGSIIGPVFSAALMSVSGPAGFFLGNILLLGMLLLYTVHRARRAPAIPVHEQESFVTITPEVMPAFAELDPRNDQFDETANPIEELFDRPAV